MKVTVSPAILSATLHAVSRAISTRSTLPVLNNVLLETTPHGLRLTATNLEITVRKQMPAEVEREGRTTVPARLWTDFVATLPESQMTMELDSSNQTLHLRCASYDTHIKCIDAEEFPPGPLAEDGEQLEFASGDLLRAIGQVQIAAASDDSRPILTGIMVLIEQDQVTMAATDGHRLAVRSLKARSGSAESRSLVVPARALGELERVLKGESESIRMVMASAGNQVFFRAGSAELNSRLMDGTYPNYGQVVPASSLTKVRLDTADLLSTARSVSLFAKDSANVLRIRTEEASLVLMANTNEVGDNTASVAAEIEGADMQIAINARYLLDVLVVLGSEKVQLELNDPLKPGLISVPGADDYKYVIMPVRVAM